LEFGGLTPLSTVFQLHIALIDRRQSAVKPAHSKIGNA